MTFRKYIGLEPVVDGTDDKQAVLFIHPTKTAGTALGEMLKPQTQLFHVKHRCLTRRRPDVKIVMTVRRPYERLHSLYHFLKFPNKPPNAKVVDKRRHLGSSFEEFILMYPPTPTPGTLEAKRARIPRMYRTEVEGISRSMLFETCSGHIADLGWADHIIHFENIDAEVQVLCDTLGIENTLQSVNVTRSKPVFNIEEWTSEMVTRVNDLFDIDFTNFGYEMVEP